MPFVDTNILLYAICSSAADKAKSEMARAVLRRSDLVLSVQVLQEFFVQATRPTRHAPLSHEDALALIRIFMRFPIQETTVAVFQAALGAKARFQISFWDAAIIEAARAARCREILSEDLNPGQDYGGIRVVNPFAK